VTDRNDLAYWFPPLYAAELPVPKTVIVRTDVDLTYVLDGVTPDGYEAFMATLAGAVQQIGGAGPVFLRTGHTSGKHEWSRTCWLEDPSQLELHVGTLVEHSAMADMMGLPTNTWAVREPIPTRPLFRCEGYHGFPVTREFRLFVDGIGVYHIQPYWPPDAVEQGRPTHPHWRLRLMEASDLGASERAELVTLAKVARRKILHAHDDGGPWSVDVLQDRNGRWWITDMADAERSFKWGESL
jgi:hypothetical protein